MDTKIVRLEQEIFPNNFDEKALRKLIINWLPKKGQFRLSGIYKLKFIFPKKKNNMQIAEKAAKKLLGGNINGCTWKDGAQVFQTCDGFSSTFYISVDVTIK